jgi:kumamolisin
MKRAALNTALVVCISMLAVTQSALAQKYHVGGKVVVPSSSVEHVGDAGVRAHTNFRLMQPEHAFSAAQIQPNIGPPFPGYLYETPASIGCIYGLVFPRTTSCDPNVVLANPAGGSRAIAIVDAYDYPSAASDLATFSAQFGLTTADFTVVYASGTQPPQDSTGGWELEEALDIEWAHAMAPNAKLYLVEANSNSFTDLLQAEAVATTLVNAAGGGEVSNSWGSGEFTGELDYDSNFTTPGVVYLFSSGDGVLAQYPAVSPNVVAVGGTSVLRNQTTGKFLNEAAWFYAGSGPRFLEPRPSFQQSVSGIVHNQRGVPDISADADPNTGVWVYATNVQGTGWWVFGGTSVAAPLVTGVLNSAGTFSTSSSAENSLLYGNLGNSKMFRDVTLGKCWITHMPATAGWDFCTGVGTPKTYSGK